MLSGTIKGCEDFEKQLHAKKIPEIFTSHQISYQSKMDVYWPMAYEDLNPYEVRRWVDRALASDCLNSILYTCYSSSSSEELSVRSLIADCLKFLYAETSYGSNVEDLELLICEISKKINTDKYQVSEYVILKEIINSYKINNSVNLLNIIDSLNAIKKNLF